MWRDGWFRLALAAGPLYWLVHGLLIQAPTDLTWPLRQPAALLLLVVVYPVLEEIVFRQLVQYQLLGRLLRYRCCGISAANLAASTAFAATHALMRADIGSLVVFFPSLLFGFFRDRHRQLRSPIVLHSVYNAGYVWLFYHPA